MEKNKTARDEKQNKLHGILHSNIMTNFEINKKYLPIIVMMKYHPSLYPMLELILIFSLPNQNIFLGFHLCTPELTQCHLLFL